MNQTGTCTMCLQPDVPLGGCGFFAPDHCYACCAHKDIWTPVEVPAPAPPATTEPA